MIRVNNKKAIRHVADVSFKAEKSRNLFAVVAIILTTILFSGLFTIGSNLLSSMEESTMRQVGGSAHAGFKYLDEEKYNRLKNHPLISEISYSVLLGFAENTELNKRPTEIRYVNDEKEAGWMFSMPTVGRLPEKENELATDTLVLKALGVEPKLGEQVNIKYSIRTAGTISTVSTDDTASTDATNGANNTDVYEESFELVGFWEGDIIASTSMIWLSKDYVNNILGKYDPSGLSDGVGNIFADVMLVNKNNAEEKLRKIITDSGYSENDIQTGVNWAYFSSMKPDSGTVLGITAVLMIIIFCGYLIISNIFLISVSNDIRFYGLLKTIGTTGRQLKTLIRRQAFLICLIGIPAGSILGIFTGSFLTPVILSNFNVNVIKVKLNPLVFVLTAAFSAITVWISIQKALKTAAKVSPVEALRVTDGTVNMKRTTADSGRVSIFRMALCNMRRNMKKTVFVVISISLSLLALNIAYSMADSFDMDKYLKDMITHDFVIGDVSWFNVYINYTDQATVSDEFMSHLTSMDGVESAGAVYFHEEAVKTGSCHLYGLDDARWDDLKVIEGTPDMEKLKTGKYVVAAPYNADIKLIPYHPGDIVEIEKEDGSSIYVEVLSVAQLPYNLSIKHSHPVESDFLMPAGVFEEKIVKKAPMIFTCDVREENMDEVEEFLKAWCEQDPDMQYASKETYTGEYESSQRMFKSVGVVVSVLLGLIGTANFANTVITSVMVRKRELAILESVGMTKRQQSKMMLIEGLLYIAFSLVFALTIGTAVSIMVLRSMLGTDGYFTVRYTVLPALATSPVYIILSMVIPLCALMHMSRKSIVERLRDCE